MNHLLLANALTSIWHFFYDGGVFMFVLLGTSIFSFTLIIWRIVALKRENVIPKAVEDAVSTFTPTEANLSRLLDLIKKHDSPFSRIVLQACRQFSWTKAENLTALQTLARKEIHHLEGGLTLLEVIVGLGPLLGLLGTISGLGQVFTSLGSGGASADMAGVAAGIAEALNATIMGLVVAIPSLIAFSVFSKRVEWLAVDMESNIESLLAKCYHEPYHEEAAVIEAPESIAPEPSLSAAREAETAAAHAEPASSSTRESIPAKPASKKQAAAAS
jgi:biopolymer transport protein ExbB